jgi:hypothetical protein
MLVAVKKASLRAPTAVRCVTCSGWNRQGSPPPTLPSKRTETILPTTGAGAASVVARWVVPLKPV